MALRLIQATQPDHTDRLLILVLAYILLIGVGAITGNATGPANGATPSAGICRSE